jgi:hypothetical protein
MNAFMNMALRTFALRIPSSLVKPLEPPDRRRRAAALGRLKLGSALEASDKR